jgi:hypothetical protein
VTVAAPIGTAVRKPFFLTRCEHCGWSGSSECCPLSHNFDDADVVCPKCGRIFLCDEVDE